MCSARNEASFKITCYTVEDKLRGLVIRSARVLVSVTSSPSASTSSVLVCVGVSASELHAGLCVRAERRCEGIHTCNVKNYLRHSLDKPINGMTEGSAHHQRTTII